MQRPQADPRAQAARVSLQPTPRRASDRSHPRSTRLSSRARSRGSVSSFLCSPSLATLADARFRSIGHVGQDQQLDRTPDGLRRFVRQAVDHEARNPGRSVRRRDREGCKVRLAPPSCLSSSFLPLPGIDCLVGVSETRAVLPDRKRRASSGQRSTPTSGPTSRFNPTSPHLTTPFLPPFRRLVFSRSQSFHLFLRS